MAGRDAAIILIRLVAPCATVRGLHQSCPASVARVRLVDPLYRRLSCFSFSHVMPNHTFPVSTAHSRAPLNFSLLCSAFAPLVFLLLRRLAAPPVFSFPGPAPRGVGGAPRGALLVRSRLRSATTVLARHGTVPATGTAPVDAPPWRFSAEGPRVMIPTVPPYHAAPSRGPAARPSRSGPAASRPQLHRGFGTPHPAPPQNVSGDAPHERGWDGYSMGAVSSQSRIRT
jgi:hypothetical protein